VSTEFVVHSLIKVFASKTNNKQYIDQGK